MTAAKKQPSRKDNPNAGNGRNAKEDRKQRKQEAFEETLKTGRMKRFFVDPAKLEAKDYSRIRHYREQTEKKK